MVTSRVAVYIDGFNLYHGLREGGLRRYYWLDVNSLGMNLLLTGQHLRYTKYFTARIAGPPAPAARQTTNLEALSTLPQLTIIEGEYQTSVYSCSRCHAQVVVPKEKRTDVNICVELLCDAADDAFDVAIVVSGDSDLTPAIVAVLQRHPSKRIVVAFPPNRHSTVLQTSASAWFTMRKGTLKRSQLPPTVYRADGFALQRPLGWI